MGQALVQEALLTHNCVDDKSSYTASCIDDFSNSSEESLTVVGDCLASVMDSFNSADNTLDVETGGSSVTSSTSHLTGGGRGRDLNCGRAGKENREGGTTSFALRVADSYSRSDSRTIVKRAGAARVAASALGLLRSLLVDWDGKEEESLACAVEFCGEHVWRRLYKGGGGGDGATHRCSSVRKMLVVGSRGSAKLKHKK